MASVLEHNSTLTGLNISGILFNSIQENNIGDEGAKALASALEHNSTLNSLNLSGIILFNSPK